MNVHASTMHNVIGMLLYIGAFSVLAFLAIYLHRSHDGADDFVDEHQGSGSIADEWGLDALDAVAEPAAR